MNGTVQSHLEFGSRKMLNDMVDTLFVLYYIF